MKYSLLIFQLFISFSLFAQIELVADINEGPDDSGVYCNFGFTANQDCVVSLEDKFIFIATSSSLGRELYVLEDGTVSLLRDINISEESSNPTYLTLFKGFVYFIANDGTGYKIWRTDGTTQNTEIAFDLGLDDVGNFNYTVFLVNGDELYFELFGTVYAFDGQDLKSIPYESDIEVGASSNRNSFGWCTYKDGIAILDYNGTAWDLLYIHDGIAESILVFDGDDTFVKPYGMAAFDGGLIFSFDAAFDDDINGSYVYLEESGTAIKQDHINVRSVAISKQSCMAYTDSGFTLHSLEDKEGEELITGVLNLTQGEDWYRTVINDEYFAFQSNGGVFEDTRISLYNATEGSLKTIYEGDDLTNMHAYANYLMFFAESLNSIFDEALFVYDLSTGELNSLAELEDLPFNADLYPIGVQGEYLYFFGKTDNEIGVEVQRIHLDISTSVVEGDRISDISFNQSNANTFQLKTENDMIHNVDVYTTNGQLIMSQDMRNNSFIEIPYSGLAIIRTTVEGRVFSITKYVNKD